MRAITCEEALLDRSGLLAESEFEQAAFFLAQPGGDDLRLVDVRAIEAGDLEGPQGDHVSLADHVRPELIAWAWAAKMSLVEAHSHPGGDPVCMSRYDITGLAEWVPHVRWRLGGRPYAALVFGPHTVDAIAWTNTEPVGVAALAIDERPPQVMTGLSIAAIRRTPRHA